MHSVPVTWLKRDGSNTLSGVLVLDGGTLCLQYQTLDWHQGAQHPNARELRLTPDSIVHASFHNGFLWSAPRIEIQTSDFTALTTLDADQSGHLSLRLRGTHRRAAKALVAELHSAQAEVRYKRWSQDMDRMVPAAESEKEGGRQGP